VYIAETSELFGDLKVKAFVGKDWPEIGTQILARIDALAIRIETGVNKYGETRGPGVEGVGPALILNDLQDDVQLLDVQCDDAMYGMPYVPYDHDGGPSYDVAFVCTSLGGTGEEMPTVVITDTGALTVAVAVDGDLTITIDAGVTTLADIAAAMAADADVHAIWTMWVDASTLLTETADEVLAATQATCNHGQEVEYTLYLTLGGQTLRPYMLRGTDAVVGTHRVYSATVVAFYVPAYAAVAGNPVYEWVTALSGVTGAGLLAGDLYSRRTNTPFAAVWSTTSGFGTGASAGAWIPPVDKFADVDAEVGMSTGDRIIDTGGVAPYVVGTVYEYDGDSWDLATTPVMGTTAYNEDDDLYYRYSGAAWEVLSESIGHNTLEDLQGGAVGEYYHLTAAEHTLLSGLGVPGTPIGGAAPVSTPIGAVPQFQSTVVDNTAPQIIVLDAPVPGVWIFQIQHSTDTGAAGQLVTVQVDGGGGDLSYRQAGDFTFGGVGEELIGKTFVITCDGIMFSVMQDPEQIRAIRGAIPAVADANGPSAVMVPYNVTMNGVPVDYTDGVGVSPGAGVGEVIVNPMDGTWGMSWPAFDPVFTFGWGGDPAWTGKGDVIIEFTGPLGGSQTVVIPEADIEAAGDSGALTALDVALYYIESITFGGTTNGGETVLCAPGVRYSVQANIVGVTPTYDATAGAVVTPTIAVPDHGLLSLAGAFGGCEGGVLMDGTVNLSHGHTLS